MKILMPFPYLEIFDRYVPQMSAIAERIDEFHVAYTSGIPDRKWEKRFIFHKFMDESYKPSNWKSRNIIKGYFRNVVSLYKFRKLLNKPYVDLYYVLSGSPWTAQLALDLAIRAQKPFVLRLRGDYLEELKRTRPWWIRHFYEANAFSIMNHSTKIIPISQCLRQIAVSWGMEDKLTESVGLGVDIKHFQPMGLKEMRVDLESPFTLGYVGRLSEEKGVTRLMTFAISNPDVKFLFAGRKQCNFQLPDNAEYFGRIPFQQMPLFYDMIDALILPSYTEGFPNVILEAYACEKPVLATEEAWPIELDVFGKVGKFQEFPVLLDELKQMDLGYVGKQARAYVTNNYTWAKFGDKMVKELEATL